MFYCKSKFELESTWCFTPVSKILWGGFETSLGYHTFPNDLNGKTGVSHQVQMLIPLQSIITHNNPFLPIMYKQLPSHYHWSGFVDCFPILGHCLLVLRSRGARRARRARRAREAREARRARGARLWGPWGPWSPSSPWGPWGQGRVNECLLFSDLLVRTPLCDCWCPNLPVILPGQCVDPSQCRIEC